MLILLSSLLLFLLTAGPILAQDEEYEPIDSSMCADCHEASSHGSAFADEISHSVHDGLECLDCHAVFHPGIVADWQAAKAALAEAKALRKYWYGDCYALAANVTAARKRVGAAHHEQGAVGNIIIGGFSVTVFQCYSVIL